MEIYQPDKSPLRSALEDSAVSSADYEHRLDQVLATLPRLRSEDEFTPQLLERLDRHRARQRRWRSLAAAAVLLISGVATAEWHEHREREQAVQELVDMRLEYRVLKDRLEDLEREATRRRPVVYLGESDGVEYVIDLSKLATYTNPATLTATTPPQPSI